MTQGISNSLNLALARMSYIENSFAALESVSNKIVSQKAIESDFKKVLDEKIVDKNLLIEKSENAVQNFENELKTAPVSEVSEEIKN